jgi:dissimilatory sulfite reductase related protein
MAEGHQVSALGYYVRSIAGKEIPFDGEGFLWEPNDWSEEVAEILARERGLETLSEDHWRVIRFLREYYMTQGKAPLSRELKAGLGLSLMELESMFPGGTRQGARLVAGLPNPKTCQ